MYMLEAIAWFKVNTTVINIRILSSRICILLNYIPIYIIIISSFIYQKSKHPAFCLEIGMVGCQHNEMPTVLFICLLTQSLAQMAKDCSSPLALVNGFVYSLDGPEKKIALPFSLYNKINPWGGIYVSPLQ